MITICRECQKGKRVHWSKKRGCWLCDACRATLHYHDAETHEICFLCKKKKHVACRLSASQLRLIYTREKERGQTISTIREPLSVQNEKPVCQNCYHKFVNLGQCVLCAKDLVPIGMRMGDGRTICHKCAGRAYERKKP